MGPAATAACGVLLGCAISMLETVQQPIAEVDFATIWAFLRPNLQLWGCCGVGWAFVARTVEPRLGLPGLVAAGILTSLVFSGAALLVDPRRPIGVAANALPLDAFTAHILWTNTFYGGLYLAAYAGWRRSVRSRRALARMRLARDESAALLQQSQVEAFRRALQPQTILQAVGALRRLYRRDTAEGDALLETLVGFLRPATRSLAADEASFGSELDLASRYLQLRSQTVGGVGELLIDARRNPPDASFPPRLLMPLLEALCLAGGKVGLRAGWQGDDYVLSISAEDGAPDAIAPTLRRRLAALANQPGFSSQLIEAPGRLLWVLSIDRYNLGQTPRFTGAEA